MTRDIVVVTDTDSDDFANEVFKQVKKFENEGFTCEIKFSTTEKDSAWHGVQYSAMIHVYEE